MTNLPIQAEKASQSNTINIPKKTILLVSSSIPTTLLFRGELIQSLMKLGHKLHIIGDQHRCNHGVALDDFPDVIFHHHTSPKISNPFVLRDIIKYYRCLSHTKPDLILLFETKSTFLFLSTIILYDNLHNTTYKQDTTVFLPGLGRYRELSFFAKKASGIVFKQAQKILCLNADDQHFLRTQGLNATLFPTEYINDRYNTIDKSKITKFEKQERKIYFIGRFDRGKGIENLIKAIQIHNAQVPSTSLSFHFIGYGLKEYETQIEQLTMSEKNVYYLGKQDPQQIHTTLNNDAHCLILPSLGEGSPTVIREALSSLCNVITTTNPGCNTFFFTKEYHKVAYSCSKGAIEQIVNALLQYERDVDNHEHRVINGMKLIEERFTNNIVNNARQQTLGDLFPL